MATPIALQPREGNGVPRWRTQDTLLPPQGSWHQPLKHRCPRLSGHRCPVQKSSFFPQGPTTHQQASQQGMRSQRCLCGEKEMLGEMPSHTAPCHSDVPAGRRHRGQQSSLGEFLLLPCNRELRTSGSSS